VALVERMKHQEFMDTLQKPEAIGMKDDKGNIPNNQEDNPIICDEIDSFKTLAEAIANFMAVSVADEISEKNGVCVRTDPSQFIEHGLSVQNATTA
jgi:hypothetical protein